MTEVFEALKTARAEIARLNSATVVAWRYRPVIDGQSSNEGWMVSTGEPDLSGFPGLVEVQGLFGPNDRMAKWQRAQFAIAPVKWPASNSPDGAPMKEPQ